MDIEIYSSFLSVALFAIALPLVIGLVAYLLIPSARSAILKYRYESFLMAIGLLSLLSIGGALLYQLVYQTPVCELCWWQRIFLFPISVVAFVAAWCKTREAHFTTAILALFGLGYALYHYYYHFQGLVLGNMLALPCSSGGLFPACTESPILTFGFITIPFMGILVFASMLILAFFAYERNRKDKAA